MRKRKMRPTVTRMHSTGDLLDTALVTTDGRRIATMTREEVDRALLVEWVPARRRALYARGAMLKCEGK